MRVLVVDDNSDDRLLISRQLRQKFSRLDVEEIVDSADLARLLESDFDLVITDYKLNWTDGLEILRAAKTAKPDCPVVMFTATGTEEVAVEAMKGGLDDYVLKSPKHLGKLAATVRAVTDRARDRRLARETEAGRRRRFDEVPVGLYRCTPDGEITDANPALARMLGYPSRDALLGANLLELHARDEDRRRWHGLMQRRGPARGLETRLRRRRGRPIWVEHNSSALRQEGEVRYVEGSLADITERKRAGTASR